MSQLPHPSSRVDSALGGFLLGRPTNDMGQDGRKIGAYPVEVNCRGLRRVRLWSLDEEERQCLGLKAAAEHVEDPEQRRGTDELLKEGAYLMTPMKPVIPCAQLKPHLSRNPQQQDPITSVNDGNKGLYHLVHYMYIYIYISFQKCSF